MADAATETATTAAAMRAVRDATPAETLPESFLALRAQVDLALQRGDATGWACVPLGNFDANDGALRFRLDEDEARCNGHAHAQARRLLRAFRRAFPDEDVWLVEPTDPTHLSFTVAATLPEREGARARETAYFTVAPSHAYLFDCRGTVRNWSAWQWHSHIWREEVRWVGALPVFVEFFAGQGDEDVPVRGPYKTYDPVQTLVDLMLGNDQKLSPAAKRGGH